MPADPIFDLSFRPETYDGGPAEIDYPILAEAPMYGGGSYLPRLKPGEVEIAGVALASTLGDVYSIRARRTATGRISYRIVDEYGTRIPVSHPLRPGPLTLGDLIEVIDATDIGLGQGLIESLLDHNWQDGEVFDSPGALRDFVVVLSSFYPQLEAYYDGRVAAWVEAHRKAPGLDAGT